MKREVPEGHHVRFAHWRYVRGEEGEEEIGVVQDRVIRQNGLVRDPHGGMTEAFIFNGSPSDETLVAEGAAYCSELDNYDRRIGRAIALGRALKALEEEHRILALVAGGMSREEAELAVRGARDGDS